MNIKVGDRVRFLNDIGGGSVTRIIDRLSVMVMNEFDFEVPARINDLVVIESTNVYDEAPTANNVSGANSASKQEQIIIDKNDIFYPEVAIDNANGDDLKVFLAFVPQGRPGNSDLNLFLINDSNYNVFYSIINIDGSGKSYSNSVGVLDANTKEQIDTLALASVNEIPEYIFQLVFYKKGDFKIKDPVSKSIKINPVKFYKEKSYIENDFFEKHALMQTVFTDNALLNEIYKLSENELSKVLRAKETTENKPVFASPRKNESSMLEVDLHIHELLDDFRGLTNSEILEVQMEHFKNQLEDALKSKIRKVVFIHGVGNGTLKLEIRKELDRRNKQLTYQDASFKEYGYGATMVQLK